LLVAMPKRSRPQRSTWDLVVEEALSVPGVAAHPSQFSPRPALWVDGREFVHLHRDRHLDIRLTRAKIRAMRDRIAAQPCLSQRGAGDWLEVDLRSPADLPLILELMRAALAANRRHHDEPPVPDDATLKRRRRLHGASVADLGRRGTR
jgi:hypothetical protein